jgi:hypothetical protein
MPPPDLRILLGPDGRPSPPPRTFGDVERSEVTSDHLTESPAVLEQPTFLQSTPRIDNLRLESEVSSAGATANDVEGSCQEEAAAVSDASPLPLEIPNGLKSSVEWRRRIKACLPQREAEQAELLGAYLRLLSSPGAASPATSEGAKEIILLSGPCGSGKTRLAKETLRQPVLDAGGYFLSGKFDRLNLQSPAPYTAFRAAFSEFTNQVLSRGPAAAQNVRDDILRALGDEEAAALARMIPELEPLCGRFRESGAVGAPTKEADAIARFVFVFKNFLCAVASPDQPVVLLLDDIHFAVR